MRTKTRSSTAAAETRNTAKTTAATTGTETASSPESNDDNNNETHTAQKVRYCPAGKPEEYPLKDNAGQHYLPRPSSNVQLKYGRQTADLVEGQ